MTMTERKAARAGQSIVEVIVALAVLMTAVSASLTLAISTLNAQRRNGARMVAVNLAREGVEVARSVRDGNWLAGRDWDEGLVGSGNDYTAVPSFDPATGGWSMDFGASGLLSARTQVWRHAAGTHLGAFVHASSQPSNAVFSGYRRLLYLEPLCSDQSIKADGQECGVGNPKIGIRIRSLVAWGMGGSGESVLEIDETMYDWR